MLGETNSIYMQAWEDWEFFMSIDVGKKVKL